MLDASQKFIDHLRASHSRLSRAGVWLPDATGAYVFDGYVGISDGSLTVDSSRNILRQATLTITSLDSLLAGLTGVRVTRDYLEKLTADSAELTIEWGMRFPNGIIEWVQVARLRVEESRLATTKAALQVSAAYDGGARIADFDLVTVYAPYDMAGTKLTCLQAIQDLVNVSYPSAAPPVWIVDPSVDTATLPPDGTSFTGSRWSAIQSLAAAINVTVWPDPLGRWVVRPVSEQRTPVWWLQSGADGVLVSAETTFSRRDQFNAVAIRWENPKGGGGLVYLVDADPSSPTYYDGPFGRKPRPEETVSTITTEQQAIDYARTVLKQSRGRTRGIDLSALHMPLLEPGDVLAVMLPDGSAERHVIDSLTLPLAGSAAMGLQTRILRGGITYEQAGVAYDDPRFQYDGQEVPA